MKRIMKNQNLIKKNDERENKLKNENSINK